MHGGVLTAAPPQQIAERRPARPERYDLLQFRVVGRLDLSQQRLVYRAELGE